MKILIWLLCALAYGVLTTILSYCGISLGGLSAVLLAGLSFWLARSLCKRVEAKPANKNRTNTAAPLNTLPQLHEADAPPAENPVVSSKPVPVIVPTVLLAVATILLLILNIVQYTLHIEDLAALNQENMILSRTVSSQNEEIAELQNELSDLSDKIFWYDVICDSLSYGNFGYASDNFNADRGIVVVKYGESEQKFILTAHWPGSGSVSYTSDSVLAYPPASISFDADSWHTSTTITVRPNYKGVVTYTFTNDVNSENFKVLIIVT